MMRPLGITLIACGLLLTITLLLCVSNEAHAQTSWTAKNITPTHPENMTPTDFQEWQKKLEELEKALADVSDPNKYEKDKYECPQFSDFTAEVLEKKCFTVKRAMSTNFTLPNGGSGEHHWIFVVTKIGNKEIWIPVECTPPEGEKQKGETWESPQRKDKDRLESDQWPKVAWDEEYSDPTGLPKLGAKFDERYFGEVKIKDVPKTTSCKDPLAAITSTNPLAIVVMDGVTGAPLSLPLELYRADGILVNKFITGADGTASINLPPDTYYLKANIKVLWFHVPVYTSPELSVNRPYDLRIIVHTGIPAQYVSIAAYALCGIVAALVIHKLVRIVL